MVSVTLQELSLESCAEGLRQGYAKQQPLGHPPRRMAVPVPARVCQQGSKLSASVLLHFVVPKQVSDASDRETQPSPHLGRSTSGHVYYQERLGNSEAL